MKPLFSFGVISDCQYRDADDATVMSADDRHVHHNHYRQSPNKLREAVEVFNAHDLKFVVHLGDFVDKTIDEADILLVESNKLRAPFWHVLGNHDFGGSRGRPQEIWQKYSIENGYYSKIVNGYRFIILDSNDLGVYIHEKESDEWKNAQQLLEQYKNLGIINAYPWNGGLREQQITWLRQELHQANEANQRVVLFAHHPIFPPHSSNALNDRDILTVLDEYKITSFINGHNHFGAVGVRNSIPYITIPAVLEGEQNAFGIVDVYTNKIKIRGYGRVQDMEFSI